MLVTVLGRYGLYPTAEGNNSSYLIGDGETAILIDMGSGSLSQLQKLGVIHSIDAIVLSHLHGDHMSDYLPFRYYFANHCNFYKNVPLQVYCPSTPVIERDLISFNNIQVNYLTNSKINIGNLQVEFIEMTHPVETYAVRITDRDGVTVLYTADTTENNAIKEKIEGVDMCIGDTCLINPKPNAPHIAVSKIAKLCDEANCTLMCAHLHPDSVNEIYKEAKTYCKRVVLPREGVTYRITKDKVEVI